MFTDLDYRFVAVVRQERTKFYRRLMRESRVLCPSTLMWLLKRLMTWPVRCAVWIPKTLYLLWLFKIQPPAVQEKLIFYLPAADGCLAVALDLYNTERYIEHMKSRDHVTLVAVRYRFGFIIVV